MVAKGDKSFVYKLIISQLHHDGYNALALLMEQMLLSSRKVQPSDCLTQLLVVCKAVSFADNDLLLEDVEQPQPSQSPDESSSSTGPKSFLPATIPCFDFTPKSIVPTLDLPAPTFMDTLPSPTSTTTSTPSPHSPLSNPLTVPMSISRPKAVLPTSTTHLSQNFLPTLSNYMPSSTFPLSPQDFLSPNPLFQNAVKVEQKEHLFNESLQDVVKALSASTRPTSLSSSSPQTWPNHLLSQMRLNNSRQHKLKNCPVCRKVLVASSLYLHMKIHTGEKNYMCEFCTKRFLLKHHLHSHLKICPNRRDKLAESMRNVMSPMSMSTTVTSD